VCSRVYFVGLCKYSVWCGYSDVMVCSADNLWVYISTVCCVETATVWCVVG
jgi:hypothetical protein